MSTINKGKNIDENKLKQQQEKQRAKDIKQQERYWNTMITRREARDMVIKANEPMVEQMRQMFVQVKTLTEMIMKKGIATEEELNEISRPIIVDLYNLPDKVDEGSDKEEAK